MLKSGLDTVKDCETLAAGLKLLLPACEAVIVQAPAPVRWTVAPARLHTPPAAKLTAKVEDVVALTLKSGSLTSLLASEPKLIVWLALLIVNDCGRSGAAL